MHQTTKGVVDNCDALVDLLKAIENFLKRLDIYTEIPPTPVMDELVVKTMVELLSTLALATKDLKQGRSSESVLAGILYHLVQRRGIGTRDFWRRHRYRSSPTEARSAQP